MVAREGVPTEGAAARELRVRAERLARATRAAEPGAEVEVLVCRVRDEQYALDLRRVEMAQPVRDLVPVPCTPRHVAGIMNVRGHVHPVLDLAVALGLPGDTSIADASRVLFVGAPEGLVGLLVDEVLEVRSLALKALERPLSDGEIARGVAEARIVLLDLDQLLAPGRLDVAEELT
jgi:purine-binding chemotaxis protein CheW